MSPDLVENRSRIIAAAILLIVAFFGSAAALDLPAEVVAVASVGLAASLVALATSIAVLERRARLQRMLAAMNKRSSRRTKAGDGTWQTGAISFMRTLTQRAQVLKDRQIDETRRNLVSAGFRSRDAIVVYSFFKLVAPLAFLSGTALVVFVGNPIGMGLALDLVAVMAGGLIGSKLPDLVLGRRRKGRLEGIRKALPDTLDMLVICTEAGLGSDAALKRVVAETGRRASSLSEELHQFSLELAFMPDRRQALENLAERAPIPSMQAFCNTLIQAEKYGTPLARAFKVLSQEQRGERMMRAEEKAGRLPATMTVPMMIFILPALFIVLIGPAILDISDNFIGLGD